MSSQYHKLSETFPSTFNIIMLKLIHSHRSNKFHKTYPTLSSMSKEIKWFKVKSRSWDPNFPCGSHIPNLLFFYFYGFVGFRPGESIKNNKIRLGVAVSSRDFPLFFLPGKNPRFRVAVEKNLSR